MGQNKNQTAIDNMAKSIHGVNGVYFTDADAVDLLHVGSVPTLTRYLDTLLSGQIPAIKGANSGAAGEAGDNGAPGIPGYIGYGGEMGSVGDAGTKGDAGTIGQAGPPGPPGQTSTPVVTAVNSVSVDPALPLPTSTISGYDHLFEGGRLDIKFPKYTLLTK